MFTLNGKKVTFQTYCKNENIGKIKQIAKTLSEIKKVVEVWIQKEMFSEFKEKVDLININSEIDK